MGQDQAITLLVAVMILFFPIRLFIHKKFDRVNASFITTTFNIFMGAGLILLIDKTPENKPILFIVLFLVLIQIVNLIALQITESNKEKSSKKDQG